MNRLDNFRNKLSRYSSNKIDDKVNHVIDSVHDYFVWDEDYISELRDKAIGACESPIEKIFYNALVNSEIAIGIWGKLKPIPIYYKKDILKVIRNKQKSLRYIYVYPQAWVDNYRLDFLIKYGIIGARPEKLLAIECDGKSYHENNGSFTKDRQRDRALNSKRIRVLRFTGREIYEDVSKCICEVEKVISSTI